MKTKFTKYNNQNGQAVLFVVIALVMALSLGVAVSTNTITSISRVSDVDSSARALAAAEGGAEKVLASVGTYSACNNFSTAQNTAVCQISFKDSDLANAKDISKAYVYVEPYAVDTLEIAEGIKVGEAYEVRLNSGNQVQLCWDSNTTYGKHAYVFFAMYTAADNNSLPNNVSRGLIKPVTGLAGGDLNVYSGFTEISSSGPAVPYTQCTSETAITAPSGVSRLRLMPLRSDITKAMVKITVGTPGTLPSQGYKITSIGEAAIDPNAADSEKIRRAVQVIKTFPYVKSTMLDFAIFSAKDVKNN